MEFLLSPICTNHNYHLAQSNRNYTASSSYVWTGEGRLLLILEFTNDCLALLAQHSNNDIPRLTAGTLPCTNYDGKEIGVV